MSVPLGAEADWSPVNEVAPEDEGDLVYAMDRGTLVALGTLARGEFHPTRVFRL